MRSTSAHKLSGVDFAPVLDAPDGPLGARHFARLRYAVAFARGLGRAACAKHFPGLGTAAYSTDERPHVDAHVRARDLAPFRHAIRNGLRCVADMVLFTSAAHARRAIRSLLPLARGGELDRHVARVLQLRRDVRQLRSR